MKSASALKIIDGEKKKKKECSWHANEEITVRQRPFAALGRRFILIVTLEGI